MTSERVTRESIIEDVISIFIEAIAFLDEDEKKTVNEYTDVIEDFKMSSDDGRVMIRDLEKHFSIKPSNEEWEKVSLIHEITDLVIKHTGKKFPNK